MLEKKNNFPSRQNLSYLFKYYEDGRYKEAEKLAISFTKRFPKHPFSWKVLGEIFRLKNQLLDSLRVNQTSIEINSQDHETHCNLALTLKELGRLEDAKVSFQKAIELKSNFGNAHNGLAITLKELGRLEDAKISFQKAIELKSDLSETYYQLGKIFYLYKDYKKASENFSLSNNKKSKTELLKCKFEENDKNGFCKQLDYLIKKNEINAVIGSLIYRSKTKYNINRKNPFCDDPLKYIYKTNLAERYDFENVFVKKIKSILDAPNVSYKSQNLLINGVQTAGDILKKDNNFMKEIKKIIFLEVENYLANFKDGEEGFIKNWPDSYEISAWLISMKNGGKLKAHIHDSGWLSGSIYIHVPPKLDVNSGNLVVCLDYEESDTKNKKNKNTLYNIISKFFNFIKLKMLGFLTPDFQETIEWSPIEENQKKIINVVTGNLCLFPSSLHHYTIPFESKEERIVLAFDIKPK